MSDGAKQEITSKAAYALAANSGSAANDAVAGFVPKPVLICLSHLRWNLVYQRPQHLMTRFARDRRVLFVEEPVTAAVASMQMVATPEGVTVLVPHLPDLLNTAQRDAALRQLLDDYLLTQGICDFVLWYYTPMSLGFSDHLAPRAVIYDCVNELSTFRTAPPEMLERERALLKRAHLVFTGGRSLYQAKRSRHGSVHEFASAVDVKHFIAARQSLPAPADQAVINGPRLGYFGVIDERFDFGLLDAIAVLRPDWQFVLLGPVVNIGEHELPRHPNIHYLGLKTYAELPAYIAGWDVALIPFVRNESTRFISPTKTPEYLAAGKPVVSTSITDVMAAYGHCAAVRIADTSADFISAIEAGLRDGMQRKALYYAADVVLSGQSWDRTARAMDTLLTRTLA